MSEVLRRYIPLGIMMFLGILLFSEFYFVVPQSVQDASSELQNYAIIIAGFAMGLGAINLLITHGSSIMKREKDQWPFSAWLIIVMTAFTVVGLSMGTNSATYQFLFNNFYYPIDTTVYSLIGWLVVYAIYLTFRARTYETTYLLIVAFFALMGNAPIGEALVPSLGGLKAWLANVPNAASVRGFNIAMSIGAIVVGLRTLIGRERAALGG